ncbi:MAG TPA: chromate transporter [Pyrinomonadaceae bacterium]|nr:chromate transporter [Pyrinomonadaceae bacterium]
MQPAEIRVNRVRSRARNVRRRIRGTRNRLERISRTATFGGLFLSFCKIGLVGFGGGLAVIAQIRALTVNQRRWLTDSEFIEGFALAQTLPGTSAGNTVTYIGLRLRGWRGACAAMSGFILPSMLMMIVLAILYRHLRNLPDTDRLFHGFNAAVVALILVTAWRMGKNILTRRWQWIVAILAFLAVVIIQATVIEVVLASGLVGLYIDSLAEKQLKQLKQLRTLASRRRLRIRMRLTNQRRARFRHDFVGGYLTRALAEERLSRALEADEKPETTDADQPREDSTGSDSKLRSLTILAFAMPILAKLALLLSIAVIFLRIGAVTFGGGFVMVPLIESEVVDGHHWLTHQEFADATALGQITPGPVLITATFVGYRAAGTLGALVATISIFLPAFLMTIAAGSSLKRFRNNALVQSFLRGISPAVVGLLVAAALSIGRAGIHTWIGLAIAIAAVIVLARFRPNALWVILGAGAIRLLFGLFVS